MAEDTSDSNIPYHISDMTNMKLFLIGIETSKYGIIKHTGKILPDYLLKSNKTHVLFHYETVAGYIYPNMKLIKLRWNYCVLYF
jgi:hypothetical protein